MGDLDAQGNVDNSNLPAYKPRHNANATDIRRSVGVAPKVFFLEKGFESFSIFKTIEELTEETTCTEGVEIVIRGCTNGAFSNPSTIRTGSYFVKLGGTTGAVDIDNSSEIFQITRKQNKVGEALDPLEEASEGIFIPTNDPSKVALGIGITNAFHNIAGSFSQIELRIK